MPDIHYDRPCPICGGQVILREGAVHAECTECGRKFQPTKAPPRPKDGNGADGAGNGPHGKRGRPSVLRRLGSALRAGGRRLGAFFSRLYGTVYRKVRKKNSRIPLPRPRTDGPKPIYTPSPPLDEGQKALYRARQKQLASGGNASVTAPPPTRIERVADFVTAHRIFSIAVSAVAVLLLFSLLTLGITFCVKESRINKSDFRFYYGTEISGLVTERREYKFVAYRPEEGEREISHRISMTKLAALCGLTTSGTHDAPRYAVQGGHSYVRFTAGSAIADVNGTPYKMDCPAVYEGSDLWVDLYFADGILGGVTVTVDLEKNHVTATRNTTPEGTVLNPVYESISISAGNRDAYENGSGGASLPALSYKTDVSAYAADLYPTDPTYLILANKEHPLTETHVPEDLVPLTVPTTKVVELRASAARALEAMFAEMAAEGITDLSVTSGYRSYAYQASLFDYYVSQYMKEGLSYEDAVKKVDEDTARAGYSEHQTGLSVDFWTSTMTSLSNEFESTAASVWLRENAWKFGFILRYPADKVEATGYAYESWHYRFVGVTAAGEIQKNGWCFEEYLEKQS